MHVLVLPFPSSSPLDVFVVYLFLFLCNLAKNYKALIICTADSSLSDKSRTNTNAIVLAIFAVNRIIFYLQ